MGRSLHHLVKFDVLPLGGQRLSAPGSGPSQQGSEGKALLSAVQRVFVDMLHRPARHHLHLFCMPAAAPHPRGVLKHLLTLEPSSVTCHLKPAAGGSYIRQPSFGASKLRAC